MGEQTIVGLVSTLLSMEGKTPVELESEGLHSLEGLLLTGC